VVEVTAFPVVNDSLAAEVERVASLNSDPGASSCIDQAALLQALAARGTAWSALVQERCPHLFAAVPVFISLSQLQQMRAVIAAVAEVVGNPAPQAALGVYYGYDFHLNAQGAHLIEINTNAGGAFLNAMLIESQRQVAAPGCEMAQPNLELVFIEMFHHEWHLARGDAPLRVVAIVDEQPESQYLYPEFLLAKQMFEHADVSAHIVDPAQLAAREEGLYFDGQRIDLVYNRLTDFELLKYPHLRSAWGNQQVVLTPNPVHYQRYADKHQLALLSDSAALTAKGISPISAAALRHGVPQTRIVRAEEAARWWDERKQWFFKPASGYGSKGAYRGDKLTKRVFDEIMQADYVAQRLAVPGERKVCLDSGETTSLKFDVRCYVYDGKIQFIAARLYQGQTTNFRTPGGGFAPVRMVE
jgi:hypothetical protein